MSAMRWLPAVLGWTGLVDSCIRPLFSAPSVVNVFASKVTRQTTNPLFEDPLFKRFFGDQLSKPRYKRENNLGSGVIVDGNGYVLTNNHVIDGASEIQVVLGDGRTMPARIVGSDPETDIAVLQAAGERLPVASFGDSDQLQVGDVVMAIGNPFGVGQTVTMGIVGATGRSELGITDFENFIQTDAAINPGTSGGALIDALGQVVGINTAIFSQSGGSHGIGFAVPIRLARDGGGGEGGCGGGKDPGLQELAALHMVLRLCRPAQNRTDRSHVASAGNMARIPSAAIWIATNGMMER